jgi:hypothetical protein
VADPDPRGMQWLVAHVEGLGAGARWGDARAKCAMTGTVLTAASWVAKVLAWAFATLFIAGFTGVVRKT